MASSGGKTVRRVDGVCASYPFVVRRPHRYARQCERSENRVIERAKRERERDAVGVQVGVARRGGGGGRNGPRNSPRGSRSVKCHVAWRRLISGLI